MSTRANVIVKDDHDELIFYRHSDGYPEGTLPSLRKFMAWVKDGKIRKNVEQASGWLVLLGAKEYSSIRKDGEWKEKTEKEFFEPSGDDYACWKVGAYEPATSIHGDIVYLYILDLIKLQITIKKHGRVQETIDV